MTDDIPQAMRRFIKTVDEILDDWQQFAEYISDTDDEEQLKARQAIADFKKIRPILEAAAKAPGPKSSPLCENCFPCCEQCKGSP